MTSLTGVDVLKEMALPTSDTRNYFGGEEGNNIKDRHFILFFS